MEVKNPEYPAELQQIIDRASSGDASVLPALSEAFDRFPELMHTFGDIARHAETSLLALVAGSCLTAREAIARELKALRDRLEATASTELGRLLITRLSLDWLVLQHAQLELTGNLEVSGTSPGTHAAQRRLDRAHARFLAASRTLATVQQLLSRVPSFVTSQAAGGKKPAIYQPEQQAAAN
jgi:hypothetical protein